MLHIIRLFLTVEAAKTADASIIGIRLDNYNSLLFNSTECKLDNLVRVVLQAQLLASIILQHKQQWFPMDKTINCIQAGDNHL